MSRLLDPKFKYIPAAATDIGKTFAKERARLKALAETESQKPKATVRQLKERTK